MIQAVVEDIECVFGVVVDELDLQKQEEFQSLLLFVCRKLHAYIRNVLADEFVIADVHEVMASQSGQNLAVQL